MKRQLPYGKKRTTNHTLKGSFLAQEFTPKWVIQEFEKECSLTKHLAKKWALGNFPSAPKHIQSLSNFSMKNPYSDGEC